VPARILVQAYAVADYVFSDNYTLMSLADLEKSIRKDKHLPGLPSAKEVEFTDQIG
jgi:hypothetical protein